MTANQENGPLSVLVCGAGSSIGRAVALELAGLGVVVGLHAEGAASRLERTAADAREAGGDVRVIADPGTGAAGLLAAAAEQLGGLHGFVSLSVPDPARGPAPAVAEPGVLLERALAAGELLPKYAPDSAIVVQDFLPSAYAGTSLEDYMPSIKGAFTGAVRTVCRKFGKAGVRINGVHAGLVDVPEVREFATEAVRAIKVPTGRWVAAEDVAKLVAYLVIENRYMSGQVVVLDGGLTAGVTGS